MDVDASVFEDLAAEIGRDAAQQTFVIFIAETEIRLRRLRQLSCHDERAAIRQEAHALKGAAGNFGLPRVADLAKTLEQEATAITPHDYAVVIDGLEARYDAARQRLAELVA